MRDDKELVSGVGAVWQRPVALAPEEQLGLPAMNGPKATWILKERFAAEQRGFFVNISWKVPLVICVLLSLRAFMTRSGISAHSKLGVAVLIH